MEKRFKNWRKPIFDDDGYAFEEGTELMTGIPVKKYGWRCFHSEGLRLGNGCDIASFSLLQARFGIIIGENVEIGPFCFVCSWSTIDNKQGTVIINDNVKIGANSTIMPGVTVGKNSVIGAHSFVNQNIPDNVIAYGIPCKVVKKLG